MRLYFYVQIKFTTTVENNLHNLFLINWIAEDLCCLIVQRNLTREIQRMEVKTISDQKIRSKKDNSEDVYGNLH